MKNKNRFVTIVLLHFTYGAIGFFLLEFFWAKYDGSSYNLGVFALKSFIMSAFVTMILVAMYLYSINQLGIPSSDENYLNLRPKKNIQSTLSLSQIEENIRMNSDYHSVTMDDNIQLKFQVSQSWKSWGEKMEIFEVGQENGAFIYEVSSKPLNRIPKLDYGKNLENIIKLEYNLSQINS